MSAVALGVATALVALRCTLLADDPYVLGSVSRVLPATRPAFIRALNQTRRLVGCPPLGDSDDIEPPPPPFTGGQCDCLSYQVTFQVNGTQDFNGAPRVFTGQRRVRGPISGGQVSENGGNFLMNARSPFGSIAAPTPGCQAPGLYQLVAMGTPISDASLTSFSVTPLNQAPDDCGDPPPTYPPPINFVTNIDVTYEGDDGDITVNVPFVFAPIAVNFDGTLRIPLSFSLGGFEFSGNLSLPDFNLTINPPALPPGSGEDLTPVGDDDPGETIPPRPPEEKIIGVVVNSVVTQPGRVGSVNFVSGPDIVIPRAASVKFAYSIGAATFWSSDIDVKTLRAFIPCPFSQGADAAVITPYIGIESTSVEIKGFPLATTRDVANLLDGA